MALKEYAGAAPQTRLAGPLTIGDNTSFSVVTGGGSGYPTGATAPFVVVVDRGTALEEKILVETRVNETFTGLTRGYDGTAPQAHSAQAVVEHVYDAASAIEANLHTNDDTRDDHSQYLNAARHDISDRHPTAALADGSVTSAKIHEAQRWMPGDLKMTCKDEAQTGWLFCQGQEVAAATYPDLATELGTGAASRYGAAATGNIKIPDLRQRFPMGVAASGVGASLGANGGTKDAAAISHNHTANHSHTGSSVGEGQEHTHAMGNHVHGSSDGGNHVHGVDGGDTGLRILVTHGAANGKLDSGGNAEQGLPSQISTAGNHNHGNTGGPTNNNSNGRSATHTHGITVDNANVTASTTGSSGTDANIPPFITVNYLIKT